MTAPAARGVRISGTGAHLPATRLTNHDLVGMMDTSDDWIVQRTGIRERRRARVDQGETVTTLAEHALKRALEAARCNATDLDLILCATMTPEMDTPSVACRLGHRIGAGRAGAMDLNAACSGFVYALNIAHDLIRAGSATRIAIVGADTVTRSLNYSNAGRNTAVLFGDGAGAAILEGSADPSCGVLAQAMHADGGGWCDIFIPRTEHDFPVDTPPDPSKRGFVQMNGGAIFKFAVGTFPRLIEETLAKASLTPADIDLYICHQSNARILTAARERFGIPEDRVYVNIERVGNTVGASVPICLDDLARAGRTPPGTKVMFLAFGAGLTWASSLWKL